MQKQRNRGILMEHKKTFINGEWMDGTSGRILQSVNPSTGEVIAEVRENSIFDVKAAVTAAKTAFYEERTWRDMDVQTRSDILLRIASLVEENLENIAETEAMDNGKPLREAEADVDDAVHCFRYYAGLIRTPKEGVYEVNGNFGKDAFHGSTGTHRSMCTHYAVELSVSDGSLEAGAGTGGGKLHHFQTQLGNSIIHYPDV